jgi:hypothetical protein
MTTIPIIEQILTAGVALALVAVATLLGIGYTKARDEPMPQEWAKRDGVQLLHSEPRAVRMYGSPWMLYRLGQRLYRVTGEDSTGDIIYRWARRTGILPGRPNVVVEGFWE